MEKEKIGYIRKKNFIFLLAIGIYLLTLAVDYTAIGIQWEREVKLIRYCSYALCILKILMEAVYHKKRTFIYVVILFMAGVQSVVSGKRGFFFLMFFFLASYGVNIKQSLKIQIMVQMVWLVSVWVLCCCGIFENVEFYRHGIVTYSMGFNYVGYPGALFFAIEASWLFLRNKKINLAETIFFLMGWIFIFHFTDTRAVALLGILMVIGCYIAKYWKRSIKNGFMKFFCIAYYPVVMIFVWGMQYYYNRHDQSGIMQKLNSMLSGRLQLNKHAIETYGLKIFGSDITWITNLDNRTRNIYNYVDSTYFKVLFDFGLIVGVLFLLLNVYVMYYMWRNDQLAGIIVMCAFSILAFMTPIVGLNTNPLLLLAGGIFYEKPKVHQT